MGRAPPARPEALRHAPRHHPHGDARYGRPLLELGRAERAVDILQNVVPELEIVAGIDAKWTINAKESLAVALAASGNEAEARSVAERTVSELELVLGPDHAVTVDARLRFERRDWRTGETRES